MEMTLKQIKEIPNSIFEQDDVRVVLNPVYDEEVWGVYFPEIKLIELNILDEEGLVLDHDLLVKTICHELAHHIQYKIYKPKSSKAHDEKFQALLWQLLGMYYEGKIPEKVAKLVEEEQEGLFYD